MISTSRRKAMRRLAVASGSPLFGGLTLPPVPAAGRSTSSRGSSATTNWTSYGADLASSKYSPLDQISAANFDTLEVAWTWRSPDEPIVAANDLKTWAWEVTALHAAHARQADDHRKLEPIEPIEGVPLCKPPYGRLTAIDLNTGSHRWMTPVGDIAHSVESLRSLGLKDLVSARGTGRSHGRWP